MYYELRVTQTTVEFVAIVLKEKYKAYKFVSL